ncbi:DUF2384 domain-containing protein [Roseomonas sp. SSH11]|uniref:DUF2384 domain-containing protein n=1 Tax=Pararoseomonas baculiformis TaxID=2820812 RepID=A0ABS4AL69_9PROT|nr:MbcA/ParS/Xre antitoxin family protein [Pararoseomonas baculiformis]MBP0447768.1 DUF2384 domain-containing protein [Pararoseomonas baculiformis]
MPDEASLRDHAIRTFGDPDRAHIWLARPTTALEGRRPEDLLNHEAGRQKVLLLLTRIDHGLAS